MLRRISPLAGRGHYDQTFRPGLSASDEGRGHDQRGGQWGPEARREGGKGGGRRVSDAGATVGEGGAPDAEGRERHDAGGEGLVWREPCQPRSDGPGGGIPERDCPTLSLGAQKELLTTRPGRFQPASMEFR